MEGIYSKNKFLKKFPKIIQTYFQGSESTIPEDDEYLFDIAKNKLKYCKKNKLEFPKSMILFKELRLAEKSKSNPLKSKLEYLGKEQGINFIGVSNYSFDTAKVKSELIQTSYNIVENISEKLKQ
jgi:hypothetical protein